MTKKYTEQDLERIDLLIENTYQPNPTNMEQFLLLKLRQTAHELRSLIVDKIKSQEIENDR